MCARPAIPGARQALLEAAREEFANRGLAGARVEDIARRAGVSKGGFYSHFKSKEGLYAQILEQFFAVFQDLSFRHREAEAVFVQVHGPLTADDIARGTQRFQRALELECNCDTELLDMLWRNRRILAILDSAPGSAFVPMLLDFRSQMTEMVANSALSRQAISCFRRDIDSTAMADLVVGTYESFARRMLNLAKKPDLRAWVRTLLIVIYQGAVQRSITNEEGVPLNDPWVEHARAPHRAPHTADRNGDRSSLLEGR